MYLKTQKLKLKPKTKINFFKSEFSYLIKLFFIKLFILNVII